MGERGTKTKLAKHLLLSKTVETLERKTGSGGREDCSFLRFIFLVANVDPQFLLKITNAIFKINMILWYEGRKTMASSNR